MIELIYNEEEEFETKENGLPMLTNVKQMGQPGGYKKIYMEDFVHTYLVQYGMEQQKDCIAVLLGKSLRSGGNRYIYIEGAVPVKEITEKQGRYDFSEKVWGTIYQECEKYFSEQEIMGWFLARPGFVPESNRTIETTHCTYFAGADKVLLLLEPMQGDCAFWGFDGNRFAKQGGYYIYYEKNDAMREFMMRKDKNPQKMSSNERPDVAMKNFRKLLTEKQKRKERRKKKVISYGMKVAVTMVLFVGAVALKNKTDELAKMEKQLKEMRTESQVVETSGDNVIVEELPGEVEPEEEIPVTEELVVEEVKEPEKIMEVVEETIEPTEDSVVQESYTVKMGDTLAGISRAHYGTDDKISEICDLNGIENGDYIQVGEIILLP